MQQPPPPISANGVVETLMESFCQCFGTEPPSKSTTNQRLVDDDDVLAHPSTPPRNGKGGSAPSTPERKQRRPPINPLFKLQQRGKEQWNSFFFGQQPAPTTPQEARKYDHDNMTNLVTPQPLQPEFTSSTVTATSRHNRSSSKGNAGGIDQKSRSSSKSSSPKSQQGKKGMTKRKRTASRDDIFRCKRDQQQPHNIPQQSSQFNNVGQNGASSTMNPFLSRFLSGSSPVCMATLCFATPIQGDSSFEDNDLNNNTIGDDGEDDDDAASSSNQNDSDPNGKNASGNNNSANHNDMASVVSDSNTLNTAEDTITSTLYYETTKLAGLKQTNPLMPLYNIHAVGDAKDDIHQIVHLRTQRQNQPPLVLLSNHRIPPQQYTPSIPPPQQVLQENNMDDDDDDEEEDDSGDEHMYSNNANQTSKQQQPLTPTMKAPPQSGSGSARQYHYNSPARITPSGYHSNVILTSSTTTPNQSPLPPVSKLSSDSSKS